MPKDIELWQSNIWRHLYRIISIIPGILEVRHGVPEALNLHGAHLGVEGEVSEVHGTGGLDGEPHAPQHVPGVHDPQELVLRGGLVEQSDLLVDKECVRNPDLLDVLSTNNQLLQVDLSVKSQPEKKSQSRKITCTLRLTLDPSRIA